MEFPVWAPRFIERPARINEKPNALTGTSNRQTRARERIATRLRATAANEGDENPPGAAVRTVEANPWFASEGRQNVCPPK